MVVCGVEWVLLILVILKAAFSSSGETCKKLNVCSCELSNGSKINLKPVDETITGLESTGMYGLTFDWNPCTPLKVPHCTQDNLLVAQVDDKNTECYPAGTDDTSFSVESTDVVITYGAITSGSSGAEVTRSTKITLHCDPTVASKRGTWTDFKETKPAGTKDVSIYSATYTSKYACVQETSGLSAGSILLIIFFPLVLMYLIIGMLINRYGRGIQSVPELIPNHSFWADFPFLVKDGVVFTCCCIKGACSSLYRKCNKDAYAEI